MRTHYVGGKLYEAIDDNGVVERKHTIGDFAVITDYVAANERDEAYSGLPGRPLTRAPRLLTT